MGDNGDGGHRMETSMTYSDDDDIPELPAHIQSSSSSYPPYTVVQDGLVVPLNEDGVCTSTSTQASQPPFSSPNSGSFNRNLDFFKNGGGHKLTSSTSVASTPTDKKISPVLSSDNNSNSNIKQLVVAGNEKAKTSSNNNPDFSNHNDSTSSSSPPKKSKRAKKSCLQDLFMFFFVLVSGVAIYYFVVELHWNPLRNQLEKVTRNLNSAIENLAELKIINEKYRMEVLEQRNLLASLEAELKLTTGELSVVKMEMVKQGNFIDSLISQGKIPSDITVKYSSSSYQDDTRDSSKATTLSTDDNNKYELVVSQFRRSVKTMMKSVFPSQPRDSWVQILAAAMSTMSVETPIRPSAILILIPPSIDPDFGLCFARKIAKSVNEAFRAGSKQVEASSEMKKVMEIDDHYFNNNMLTLTTVHDDIKNYLDYEGKAVIVKNLDEIKLEEQLLVLHAFCDNSNYLAYDTRANFIFTLNVPPHIHRFYEWTHWNGVQIARQTLNEAWATALSPDKRAPLISRVAASVILIQDGDSCS